MRLDNQIIEEILYDSGIEAVTQIHSIVHSSADEYRGELPRYLEGIHQQNPDQIIDQLWWKVREILPLTIQSIKAKVLDVFIVDSSSTDVFLLYVFVEDDIYLGFRGNLPIKIMPSVAIDLSVDLSIFYSVHNGWYEIDSNDGLLQAERFEVFQDPDNNKPNFLKVFQKGVNTVGFDIDSTKKEPYVLWVEDDDVEEIIEFWKFIDEWLSTMLEDVDNR